MARKTKAQLEAELHKLDTGQACAVFRRGVVALNQKEFWGRVGVTQSGGSRYESGREMPEAVQALLALVYCDPDRTHEVASMLRSGTWDFNCNRPQAAPLSSIMPPVVNKRYQRK